MLYHEYYICNDDRAIAQSLNCWGCSNLYTYLVLFDPLITLLELLRIFFVAIVIYILLTYYSISLTISSLCSCDIFLHATNFFKTILICSTSSGLLLPAMISPFNTLNWIKMFFHLAFLFYISIAHLTLPLQLICQIILFRLHLIYNTIDN